MRFKFPDATQEEISLAEVQKARLRQADFMVKSNDPELHERGEALLEEIAQSLASNTLTAAKRQKATAKAAQIRRAQGDLKAAQVRDAIAKGEIPPAGSRHLRRIKKRPT